VSLKLTTGRLIQRILAQPESGMTWQAATVRLKDGRAFHRVIIVDGQLSSRDGRWIPPFTEDDIDDIIVTHDHSGPPFES
jgi:hypothetical protein